MRRLLLAILGLTFAACGDTAGCGGESEYTYPRFDIEATPTRRAVRVRMTETGLGAIAEGVPDLIAAGCAGGGACAMDPDPTLPDRVRMYVGSSGSLSADSYLAIDLDTMEGNVDIGLQAYSGGGGAITVTIGCDAPNVSACDDAATYGDQFIRGSLDMVVYPLGTGGGAACFIQDPAGVPDGFIIKSMRFIMEPHIELGADLKPYLAIDQSDITVLDMEVEFNFDTGMADWDAACDQDVFGVNVCNIQCAVISGGAWLADFLAELDIIDELLAKTIADLVVGQLTNSALEGEGGLDLGAQLPVGNPRATTTGFIFSATVANPSGTPPEFSPSVTGFTDNLGLNFDFDVGFTAEHGPCVPVIVPSPFVLPPPPDVGSTVLAPDPVTGDPTEEDLDLALLLGDVVLQRAAHELFDSGSLCMNIKGESITGGAFVPTVAMVSLLAPGLVDLAPQTAPVNFVLSPRYPPVIKFGTGDVVSEVRDSHLSIIWPELWVDLYPLVDESHLRALTFTVDLIAGASLEPTPTGNVALMIDRLELINVAEVYNEMTAPFDTDGLETILGLFLPLILTGDPTEVALTSDVLMGLPFVPKLRAVERVGVTGDYLAVFLRFCNGDAIGDPTNTLCYEPPGGGGNGGPGSNLSLNLQAGPDADTGFATVRVSAFSDLAQNENLELAYRVDGGPWFNFRGPEADELFSLTHPRLAVPGDHTLQVVGRHRWRQQDWSDPFDLDLTVADREPRRVSHPLDVVPVASDAGAQPVISTAPDPASGCSGHGRPWLGGALMALALVLVRRARRRSV